MPRPRPDDLAVYASERGTRLPLHATGVGKVLLAHAPPAVVAEVLGDLAPITSFTVTQPGRMARQLRRRREDGVAQTIDEMIVSEGMDRPDRHS